MYHYLLQPEKEVPQKLVMTVECSSLMNGNDGLPLDSFLIVKLIEKNKPIKQLVKSRVYWGNSHPKYEQAIELQFSFSKQQNLLVEIYQQDNMPKLYGWIQTTVNKIFGSPQKKLESLLKIEKSSNLTNFAPKITILCFKKQKSSDEINVFKMRLSTEKIKQLRSYYFFSSNLPFSAVLIKSYQNKEMLIHKSELTAEFEGHTFECFEISKSNVVSSDEETEFFIKIYQEDNKIIGSCKVNLRQCCKEGTIKSQLTNEKREAVGEILLEALEEYPKYSLSDYLDSGLEFKVLCCIDFTASNKKPTDPESLHKLNGSAYEQALKQTLQILLDYDEDKLIPTYGFGAKVFLPSFNSEGKVSHCFPLNGNIQNPNLCDIDGVIKQYRNCMNYLEFAGPTNFEQIIKNAINQCLSLENDGTQYMIVFILTDGQIHDTRPVINLIDKHSHLPLSIIMVGLGNNDFSEMVLLDGDNEPLLNNKGRKVRDIIQFVEFNYCGEESRSLAVNILEELPNQVLEFFETKKLCPKQMKNLKETKSKLNCSGVLKASYSDRRSPR